MDLTDPSITDGSSGGGILTYWVDAAATSPLSNPTSVTTSGTYYIQADNGCTDIQPVNVIVNPAPMVNSPLLGKPSFAVEAPSVSPQAQIFQELHFLGLQRPHLQT